METTHARYRVLTAIEEQDEATVADLPIRWPVTRLHLSTVLSGLHEDGLVDEFDAVAGGREET